MENSCDKFEILSIKFSLGEADFKNDFTCDDESCFLLRYTMPICWINGGLKGAGVICGDSPSVRR